MILVTKQDANLLHDYPKMRLTFCELTNAICNLLHIVYSVKWFIFIYKCTIITYHACQCMCCMAHNLYYICIGTESGDKPRPPGNIV